MVPVSKWQKDAGKGTLMRRNVVREEKLHYVQYIIVRTGMYLFMYGSCKCFCVLYVPVCTVRTCTFLRSTL